jgi:predicted CXXCH cytochrome family protein
VPTLASNAGAGWPRWLLLLALLTATSAGIWSFSSLRLEWLAETRPRPTRFDHAHHRSVNCITCHHNFRDRSLGPQGCIACHKSWGTTETRRVDTVLHAFCTDCHRRLRAAGAKAGPVKSCAACHSPRR